MLNEASNNNEITSSGEEMIQNAEKSLFELAERGHFNQSFLKFENALKQTIEMAKSAYKNEEGIVGVPTGLTDLGSRLGGMHKQDLIIIAGRPSMGKTALATNIAFHAAKNIEKKGLISLSPTSPCFTLIWRKGRGDSTFSVTCNIAKKMLSFFPL